MLYIEEGTFSIEPDKRVLKAEEYSSLLKAREIVGLAEKKSEEMAEAAKEAYEEEKKRGFEQGLEEGNERMSDLMIDSVAKSLENFEEFENDVIEVVMNALRKILGQIDHSELIGKVVRSGLEMVRNQKKVTLMVNPEEATVVREQMEDLLKEFPSINFIDVAVDARIESGGCKLETEMGVVDASLPVQLESIKKSLTKMIK